MSDHGRVRSVDRWNGTRTLKGQLLAAHPDTSGHFQIRLSKYGKRKTFRVHALVALAFIGPRPEGYDTCHADGDKQNNCISNLRYDTKTSNALDSVSHGTHNSARKTVCNRGHKLEHPNLVSSQSVQGRRMCLACSRTQSVGWSHARKTGMKWTNQEFQLVSDQKYLDIVSRSG